MVYIGQLYMVHYSITTINIIAIITAINRSCRYYYY